MPKFLDLYGRDPATILNFFEKNIVVFFQPYGQGFFKGNVRTAQAPFPSLPFPSLPLLFPFHPSPLPSTSLSPPLPPVSLPLPLEVGPLIAARGSGGAL